MIDQSHKGNQNVELKLYWIERSLLVSQECFLQYQLFYLSAWFWLFFWLPQTFSSSQYRWESSGWYLVNVGLWGCHDLEQNLFWMIWCWPWCIFFSSGGELDVGGSGSAVAEWGGECFFINFFLISSLASRKVSSDKILVAPLIIFRHSPRSYLRNVQQLCVLVICAVFSLLKFTKVRIGKILLRCIRSSDASSFFQCIVAFCHKIFAQWKKTATVF